MNDLEEDQLKLSRVSTLKVIEEMMVDGILLVTNPARKGQSHHLIINQQNEYNLIRDILSDIEMYHRLRG